MRRVAGIGRVAYGGDGDRKLNDWQLTRLLSIVRGSCCDLVRWFEAVGTEAVSPVRDVVGEHCSCRCL